MKFLPQPCMQINLCNSGTTPHTSLQLSVNWESNHVHNFLSTIHIISVNLTGQVCGVNIVRKVLVCMVSGSHQSVRCTNSHLALLVLFALVLASCLQADSGNRNNSCFVFMLILLEPTAPSSYQLNQLML